MTNQENVVRDVLVRSLAEFSENQLAPRTIRRFATETPGLFAPAAASILMRSTDSPGHRFLAMLLVRQPRLFQQLSNPALFTRPQAVLLSRRLMAVDASLDIRFARQLPARNGATPDTLTGEQAERTLDILDEISPGRRVVPILSHLTRYPDQKISSKAALLIGKRVQNVAFAKRLIVETKDPRVRANAIEAVWGNDSPDVVALFRAGIEDQHNRVVGNSIMGLYLAGQEEVSDIVKRFAHDNKADFRMTAAWTMGKMGDTDFIQTLTMLMKDNHPGVRTAALRSLQNIRRIEKMRRPSEASAGEAMPAEPDAAAPAQMPGAVPAPAARDLRLDGTCYSQTR